MYNQSNRVVRASDCTTGNAPYNDKVSFNNVKIFGYKNRSTRIVYACGEVKAEVSEDHLDTGASNWYLPGHAGTGTVCNYPASAVKIVN
uniref:Pectate lyase n=1 Tax=Meloidogyne javanica TaxID=6303 RepID=A0A915LHZ6_MELJA